MDETKGDSVVDTLEERELLVASNREPYTHSYDGDEVTVSRPAGGLTAALDPIMQQLSGTWVAWGSSDADFEVTDDRGRVEVPPDDPSYTLQRVHLSDRELSRYYYGYSNQVLWPLCHSMPTRATFDGEFWRQYRDVNETFADALVTSAESDDPAVWFHDYHLSLAPRFVREQLPEAFLTQFWHVPWPSWDVFRSCPQHHQLLEGLLGNDLLGFHSESYCESFCECVDEAIDGALINQEQGQIRYDGHTTRVQTCPLGIDAEAHAGYAEGSDVEAFWSEFTAAHDLGDRVVVGVDRLDYTKGILQRLDALEWLWEYRPERRGELTYVQKGIESRTQIDEYRNLQTEIKSRIDEINERFATDGWTPVVYANEYFSRTGLAALYRHADAALVSPLRDGMNLVAKEYVASQLDDDGVLVLSPFAGAAEALGDNALVVNPNDTQAFAATIEAALSMPERTRKRRMRNLRERVHSEDTSEWIHDQFRGIDAPKDDSQRILPRWRSTPVSVWSQKRSLRQRLRTVDGLFVMTDFDGTLADIVADPERAEIHQQAREALESLTAHSQTRVAVISGRDVDDLRERVDVDEAYYAGNHGLELYDSQGKLVNNVGQRALDVLSEMRRAAEQRFADADGIFVEDKRMTVAIHYRQTDRDGEGILAAVRTLLDGRDEYGALRVLEGDKVVEIRPDIPWGKGAAVELLRGQYTPDDERWLPIYVGDDTTDEAAFEAIKDEGVAVAVGSDREATAAPFAVDDPNEATDLFQWLADTGVESLEAARLGETLAEPN